MQINENHVKHLLKVRAGDRRKRCNDVAQTLATEGIEHYKDVVIHPQLAVYVLKKIKKYLHLFSLQKTKVELLVSDSGADFVILKDKNQALVVRTTAFLFKNPYRINSEGKFYELMPLGTQLYGGIGLGDLKDYEKLLNAPNNSKYFTQLSAIRPMTLLQNTAIGSYPSERFPYNSITLANYDGIRVYVNATEFRGVCKDMTTSKLNEYIKIKSTKTQTSIYGHIGSMKTRIIKSKRFFASFIPISFVASRRRLQFFMKDVHGRLLSYIKQQKIKPEHPADVDYVMLLLYKRSGWLTHPPVDGIMLFLKAHNIGVYSNELLGLTTQAFKDDERFYYDDGRKISSVESLEDFDFEGL